VRNLSGFSMRVLAFDPSPDENFARQYGVSYCPFEQLLKESDYISIHCPLHSGTFRLLSDHAFSMMKPSARLINCARGEIVDEKALYRALSTKRIAGAALDVYEKEPFEAGNPLFQLDNAVLSPHIAGMTFECRKSVIAMAFQNIIDLSEGVKPPGLINPEALGRC
jgi:phosphoglycerate dehydrogenase-like enzyme